MRSGCFLGPAPRWLEGLVGFEEGGAAGEIGFGDSKNQLFELVWEFFAPARKKRAELEKDSKLVEKILKSGAEKASAIAEKKLQKVRKKVGLDGNHLI